MCPFHCLFLLGLGLGQSFLAAAGLADGGESISASAGLVEEGGHSFLAAGAAEE